MVKATENLSVLSAEAPISSPVVTDGSAFYQLQEEMRAAFECTVVDLPRAMLIQHPHLISDVKLAVIVTDLTLAAARDTIRILSWLKTNAPQIELFVVANRVHTGGQLEISRKDFEGSIERKIDYLVPFDQKLAAQSAKLGKPIVEVGKASKTIAPIVGLASALAAAVADCGLDGAKASRGRSLMGKFGELRGLMTKRTLKPAKAK
jgi:pilus assembly protein CpaE